MASSISAVRTDIDSVVLEQSVTTYEGRVTEDDPTDALRLVGFVEYRQALENFDAILQSATDAELRLMDDYVKRRPEFAFFTNLSRPLESVPTSLSEPVDPQGNRQHGFAWVVGLARVEVAATLAAFVDVGQAFRAVNPSEYEMPAYRELVLDGFRTHAWSLRSDPELKTAVDNSAMSGRLLAYLRRVLLTQRFAEASRSALGAQITPDQARELATWQAEIGALKSELARNVNDRLAAVTSTESGAQINSRSKSRTNIISN